MKLDNDDKYKQNILNSCYKEELQKLDDVEVGDHIEKLDKYHKNLLHKIKQIDSTQEDL